MSSETSPPPPRKRLRPEHSVTPNERKKDEPRLFVPFRALGLVTNHIPFVLQTRSHKGATDGPRIHLLTCLGRAWALWEGGKMTLLFVGMSVRYGQRNCTRTLTSHCTQVQTRPHIYLVWPWMGMPCGLHRESMPSDIYAEKKSTFSFTLLKSGSVKSFQVLRLSNPLGTNLSFITIFGPQLLALNEQGDKMFIWNTSDGGNCFLLISQRLNSDISYCLYRICSSYHFWSRLHGHFHSPSCYLSQ